MVSSTLRPHFTPWKDPVPILQEAGWAPGPVWTGGKCRPHRDSIPDRPARSQSLYRLSYPAHYIYIYIYIYRVFHNFLRDYKHLQLENQRTYLNGIVHTKRLRRNPPPNTVVFDIDNFLAAVPVDFFGLCRKLVRTRSASSSAVNGI